MMGILLIFLLILLCEISGYLILDKINVKTRYSIVFGFLLVVAFFEVVSFPFIILQTSFTLYRHVVWILLIIFYFELFKFLKFDKEKLIEWTRTFDKTKILVYVLSIIVGVFIAIVSNSDFDSWLFMPMVLYPLQTNELTYATEHAFDGYYKMISFITYYTGNNVETNYLFIMVFCKFFEMLVFINFFGFLSEQLFVKRQRFIFLLLSIGLVSQIPYLMTSYADTEFITEVYMTSSNGTFFLEGMIIPFLFVYLFKEYKSNKLLLLVLVAGLGLSTSMIYIYGTFLILYIGYEIFVNKEFKVKELIIRIALLGLPLYVLLQYVVLKLGYTLGSNFIIRESLIIFILSMFTGLVLYRVFKVSKCERVSKNLFVVLLGAYICFIMVFLIIGGILSNGLYIKNTILGLFYIISKYDYSSYKYTNYLACGVYSILYIIGLYLAYKKERKLFILHIVAVVLLANYVIYQTLGNIIDQVVYHRVFIFASCYIFVIIAIVFLLDKLIEQEYKMNGKIITKGKYVFVYSIMGILFFLAIYFHEDLLYKFNEPFIEYKLESEDVLDMLDHDFETSDIELVINYEDYDINQFAIGQIFQLNTELNKVDVCTQDCYILQSKKSPEKTPGNKVYETQNFVLKYVE